MARSIFANLGRKATDDPKRSPKDKEDRDEAKKKGKVDADDDENDLPEEEQTETERAGRAFERRRIRAILTSAPAQLNIVGAAHLALDTDMPAAKAVAALEVLNGALAASAAARNAKEGDSARMTAAAILAAGAEARGEAPPRVPGQRQRMGYAEGYTPPESPRRGTATGPDGRPVDAAAQAIIDAGAKRRGDA